LGVLRKLLKLHTVRTGQLWTVEWSWDRMFSKRQDRSRGQQMGTAYWQLLYYMIWWNHAIEHVMLKGNCRALEGSLYIILWILSHTMFLRMSEQRCLIVKCPMLFHKSVKKIVPVSRRHIGHVIHNSLWLLPLIQSVPMNTPSSLISFSWTDWLRVQLGTQPQNLNCRGLTVQVRIFKTFSCRPSWMNHLNREGFSSHLVS